MTTVFFLFLLSLTFFVNTFYYIFSLLILVFLTLFYLVANCSLLTLTSLLLFVVYVGAIMVLFGYVCAVCPNTLFTSDVSLALVAISVLYSLVSFDPSFKSLDSNPSISLSDMFYSLDSLPLFCTLVVMLFFILLIVTSQHLLPNGPFRSVK